MNQKPSLSDTVPSRPDQWHPDIQPECIDGNLTPFRLWNDDSILRADLHMLTWVVKHGINQQGPLVHLFVWLNCPESDDRKLRTFTDPLSP